MATSVEYRSWRDSYRGMSSDNIKGLVLALSSSFFIGARFIVKKKGFKKAGATGVRAASSPSISMSLSKHTKKDGFESFDHEGIPLRSQESVRST